MIRQKLLDLGLVHDNEYLDKYVKLITENINTERQQSLTQRHHIVPKSYYKENNLDLDDTESNVVNLFHYQHILAHWYLYKCSKPDYFIYSNCYALLYMLRINELPTAEDSIITEAINYGEVYSDFCTRQSIRYKGKTPPNAGKNASPETRKKLSESHKGQKRSEESIENQSRTLRELWKTKWAGRILSEDTKGRIANTVSSLVFVNKDNVTKHVKPEEVNRYLQEGWSLGVSVARKEQLSARIKEYNKNRIITDETRRKMSEAAKNRDPAHRGSSSRPYKLMNDGLKNVRAYTKEQEDAYLSQGFIYGSIKKRQKEEQKANKPKLPRKTTKGRICITNGLEVKIVCEDELEYYLNIGWRKGRFRKCG